MFTNALTSAQVAPSLTSYTSIKLSALDSYPIVRLYWPTEFRDIPIDDPSQRFAANIIGVLPSENDDPNNGMRLPDATAVSVGQQIIFVNRSGINYRIYSNDGLTVLFTVLAATNNNVVFVYIQDNSTVNGIWINTLYPGGGFGIGSLNVVTENSNLTSTSSGSPTNPTWHIGLASDLLALTGFGGNTGIACRIDGITPAWAIRSIMGTANQINVNNPQGLTGNIGLSLNPVITGITNLTAGNLNLSGNTIASTVLNINLNPMLGGTVSIAPNASFQLMAPNGINFFKIAASPMTVNVGLFLPDVAPTVGQILGCTAPNTLGWLTDALGTVTLINTGTGLTGGPITTTGTISIAPTGVGVGTYSHPGNMTVNAQGQITSIDNNGSTGTVTSVGTGSSAVTGLIGGPITTTGTLSLSNTAVTPGTYNFSTIMVDGQGRLQAASTGVPVTAVTAGIGLDVTASANPITSTGTLNIANTAVTPGTYASPANITVNAQGQLTHIDNNGVAGTVTSIAEGIGILCSPNPITSSGTISIAPTTVTAGSYPRPANISVNAEGQITFIDNTGVVGTVTSLTQGTGITCTPNPITATGSIAITNTAVTAGSYVYPGNITVNAQGQLTHIDNNGGTVTNIATGVGLSGGPITTTGTLSLAPTSVTPGVYTHPSITVDAQGRITAANSNTVVTSVATTSDLTGGPITSTGTLGLAPTTVTAGSYTLTNLTVDGKGRITSAISGTAVTSVATTSDLTGGPITTTGTLGLNTTGVSAGSYTLSNITVDGKGRLTSATNGTAVTSVASGTGLTGGPITTTGTLSIAITGVTAGTYTHPSITVNAQGQLTAASSGTAVTSITAGAGLSGGTITSTGTIDITNTGVTAATYATPANLVVNTRGQITSVANGTGIYSSGSVTFTGVSISIPIVTAFPSVPKIIVMPNTAGAAFTGAQLGTLQVNTISTSGFTITNTGATAGGSTGLIVVWIAII